jgi:hypothetical protein
MASPNLDKALEFLEDPDLAPTNNAASNARKPTTPQASEDHLPSHDTAKPSPLESDSSMVHDLPPASSDPNKDQQTQPNRKARMT